MSTCLYCGTDNRTGVRFCCQCGKPLQDPTLTQIDGPVCPDCQTVLRPGVRFCKKCGKPVDAASATGDNSICPGCGAPVRAVARFCPQCRIPLAEPGPCCPNCGAPIRHGAQFCRMCSRPLTSTLPPHDHSSPQQPGRFGTGELIPLTTLTGRYMIMEKIAQGGMGAIYEAQDQRLENKIVAVKEMSESI